MLVLVIPQSLYLQLFFQNFEFSEQFAKSKNIILTSYFDTLICEFGRLKMSFGIVFENQDISEIQNTSTEEKISLAWKYFTNSDDYKTSYNVGHSTFSHIKIGTSTTKPNLSIKSKIFAYTSLGDGETHVTFKHPLIKQGMCSNCGVTTKIHFPFGTRCLLILLQFCRHQLQWKENSLYRGRQLLHFETQKLF